MPTNQLSSRYLPGGFSSAKVAAFLVTQGKTPYFYQTLAAIRDSRYPIASLVVVDWSKEDDPQTLKPQDLRGYGPIQFTKAPAAANFGQAVRTARAQRLEAVDYLWFLHDDSAPDRSCLEQLVRCFETSTTVAAAGPKQLSWNQPQQLASVGIKATRVGRRLQILEPNEVDQGQYDQLSDVLAVDTAGMLVQAKIWDRLGGTCPELGPFGDGLEWGRRLRLAGHRVVLVPEARLYHAQAAYYGWRPNQLDLMHDASVAINEGESALLAESKTKAPSEETSPDLAGGKVLRVAGISEPSQRKLPGAPSGITSQNPVSRPQNEAGQRYQATRWETERNDGQAAGVEAAPLQWDPYLDGPRPHQPVHHYDPVPVQPIFPDITPNLSRSFTPRRRGEYFNRGLAARRGTIFFALIYLQIMALVRAVAYLITKNVAACQGEVGAMHYLLTHLGALKAARRRIRHADVSGRQALRPLEAKRGEIRHYRQLLRRVQRERSKREYVLGMVAHQRLKRIQHHGRIAIFALLILLALISLFAGRTYFAGINGGFWSELPGSWRDLFELATNSWRTGGMGQSGSADPILYPIVLLTALPSLFSVPPTTTILVILLTSPCWAGLSAWIASGAVSRQNGVRIWIAAAWGSAFPLLAGIWAGNFSAVLLHIFLPLVGWGIISHFELGERYRLDGVLETEPYLPPKIALCGGGVAALALIPVSAAAPWLWVLTAGLLVLAALIAAFRQKARSKTRRVKRALSGFTLLLPALVVLLPSALEAWEDKQNGQGVLRAFLLQTPLSVSPTSLIDQLTKGAWIQSGRIALYLSVANLLIIALAALAGLIRSRLLVGNRLAGSLTFIGLLVAYLGQQKTVAIVGGSEQAAWSGPAFSLALLGALALAAVGLGHWQKNLVHHRINAVLLGLATLSCLAALGGWTWANEALSTAENEVGYGSTIQAGQYPTPEAFEILSQSERRSRILVVSKDSQGTYQAHLWRFAGPSLLDSNAIIRAEQKIDSQQIVPAVILSEIDNPTETQLGAVASLVGGNTEQLAAYMVQLNANQLVLLDAENNPGWLNSLQSSGDFNQVRNENGYSLWRLNSSTYPTGRLLRIDDTGRVQVIASGVLSARAQVRSDPLISRLQLAETYDSHWQAWLGNQPLVAQNVGGIQSFDLPENQGGTLLLRYDTAGRWLWISATGIVTILAALAALPLARKHEEYA